MFVYSVKASSLKYIAVMVICAVAVVLCVLLIPNNVSVEYTSANGRQIGDFKNVKSNEDRVEFLSAYGWEVDPEAIEISEVTIPSEFDEVYKKYNDIQKDEGLNLEKYAGKSVKRYVYTVKNYESETSVVASLLVYKNRIIGGDVSSVDLNGFSHGFTKPVSE